MFFVCFSIAVNSSFGQDLDFQEIRRSLIEESETFYELGMTSEQMMEYKEIRNAAMFQMRQARMAAEAQFSMDGDKQKFEEIQKSSERLCSQRIDKALHEMLLPFQNVRLNQLAVWRFAGSRKGYHRIFDNKALLNALGITLEESQKISEQAERLQEEFEMEVQELREKYQKKVDELLSKEQHEELKKLLGDRPPSMTHWRF